MSESIQEWVKRLKSVDMPVFGSVALEVSRLSQEKNVSTSRLANVILQDPSMTAKVLKVSNSTLLPKIGQVTTVSRAITLLGFSAVSKVCLSVALIDSLLKDKPKQALLKEMATTFYAGILARTIAERRKDESAEEIFVAALLYRLGALAFWSFGEKSAETLQQVLEDPAVEREKAEKTILGFTLQDLTVKLAKAWNLGELLMTALTIREEEGGRTRSIVLAHEFTDLLARPEKSEERKALLKQMSRQAQVSIETMEELARVSSEYAVDFARRIGADIAVPEIPGQKQISQIEEPQFQGMPGDPLLQLRILRELVMLASGDSDEDSIVQLGLEGLYRGTGLDRVVYLAPDRAKTNLQAKFALAADQSEILSNFRVSLTEPNLFAEACKDDQSVWAPILPPAEKQFFSKEVLDLLRDGPFLLAPIKPKGVLRGVIYADRLASARPLDSESSESFELFCFQIKQILSGRI